MIGLTTSAAKYPMIVSPTPLMPSSVSTTTSAAVRSNGSCDAQNGSPVHGAVMRTVRTAVTRTGGRSARGVNDEVARHRSDVGDAAHPGILREALAQVIEDTCHPVAAGQGHAPQNGPGDKNGPGAEGKGDQGVAAAPHASVE